MMMRIQTWKRSRKDPVSNFRSLRGRKNTAQAWGEQVLKLEPWVLDQLRIGVSVSDTGNQVQSQGKGLIETKGKQIA